MSPNGRYHGLYQFSVATWAGVGGSGLPSQASPAEQTQRAQALYNKAGRGQWPTCGRYLLGVSSTTGAFWCDSHRRVVTRTLHSRAAAPARVAPATHESP